MGREFSGVKNEKGKDTGNDIECVRDYNERRCPLFFKREFLNRMFVLPA